MMYSSRSDDTHPAGRIRLDVIIAVVAIIAIVAASGLAVQSARRISRDALRLSDVRIMQAGLELFYKDHNRYPVASATTIGDSGLNAVTCLDTTGFVEECRGKPVYLQTLPNQAGEPYQYVAEDGATYVISFTLEGSLGSLVQRDEKSSSLRCSATPRATTCQ